MNELPVNEFLLTCAYLWIYSPKCFELDVHDFFIAAKKGIDLLS